MRKLAGKILAVLMLAAALGGTASAQSRIATIDLKRVFDNYWKKKQAESQLQERFADMEKEDKNMLDDYKKVKEEYTGFIADANNQTLSPEERDKRKKSAEDKFRQMKEMEDTIMQYERTMRTTIADQKQRMGSNILKEIRVVVSAKAKAANLSLVVDTSGESVLGAPVVLYTNNENDMTDEVIKQLNSTAPTTPTESTKTEEKIQLKGDEKKGSNKK